ncbi:MAG: type II and III secretion system protein family protein [Acidobacteriaceae bacterium]
MPAALPALASTASLGAQAPLPIGLPLSADLLNQETEVPLHLLIGHSMFLKTTDKLHRVYVGSPTVLQSFIPSPKEVVITAVKPGTSSVALWNSTGQSVLYAVSADLDVSKLRRSIAEALPGQDIRVDSQEGRVYLSGTAIGDPAYQEAIKLASFYSKDVVSSLAVTYVHPQQVRLQVRIAEVDRTKLDQFGFNFFSGGRNTSSTGTQQFTSVGATQTSTASGLGANPVQVGLAVSNPLNFLLYNSKLNIGAAMADLEARNILQILAEPTITTLSGHEGDFLSGGLFPYPVIQGGAGNFASVTIMFQPYGVKLKFTPTVNADGTILLKVAPEVSALDYTNTVTLSGYTVPAISTRRAETEVELRDGQSFSISGLLDHRTTVLLDRTPGIANVPILGELFKSKNNTHSVAELVVIVTANVVDPLEHETHPATPEMALPNMRAGQFDHSLTPAAKKATKP